MINLLYLFGFPVSIYFVRKYNPGLKKKFIILIIGLFFSMIPFSNVKPEPTSITINTDLGSAFVLGKNMVKKTTLSLEPENADINKIEFVSEDYSVAYFEESNIHSASEGVTYVYAKSGKVISNKVKVIVDYTKYLDTNDEDGYVFMTSTGNKFHIVNCNVINPELVKITKEEAIRQGAEPCKNCLDVQ